MKSPTCALALLAVVATLPAQDSSLDGLPALRDFESHRITSADPTGRNDDWRDLSRAERLSAGGLRCEYRVDPIRMDVAQPRLSWMLQSDRRGERQTACWYAGRLMVVGRLAYGNYPRFLLQLEIEFADGQRQTVVTDDTWRSTIDGPIRSSGIYDGEVYDARKEMRGWDAAGFDATAWRPVRLFDLGKEQLVWQPNEPIRVVKELNPVTLTEPKPGVYVFDLGQNMVGWCRIRAKGAAGQPVTLRHAEMLNEDGTLYTANLRGAPQQVRETKRFASRSRGVRFVGADSDAAVFEVLSGRYVFQAPFQRPDPAAPSTPPDRKQPR